MSVAKPRRRWLSYSLRTLFVVVTLVAVVTGWVVNERRKSAREKQLVQGLFDKGNAAYLGERFSRFSLHVKDVRKYDFEALVSPGWLGPLGKFLGERITYVHAGQELTRDLTPIHDLNCLQRLSMAAGDFHDLGKVTHFRKLGWLEVGDTEVEDLTPLVQLRNLRVLNISQTDVRDFQPLARLTELESLDLSFGNIRNLTPLAQLKKLRRLVLCGTRVRDLSPLAKLDQLESLDVGYTQVDDCLPLATLKNLRFLSISETPVRDLAPLAGLHQLERLEISRTPVVDLTPLFSLKRLASLDLHYNPQFSYDQVRSFSNSVPGCNIAPWPSLGYPGASPPVAVP